MLKVGPKLKKLEHNLKMAQKNGNQEIRKKNFTTNFYRNWQKWTKYTPSHVKSWSIFAEFHTLFLPISTKQSFL